MSRAQDYLKMVLTPEQYADYRRHANLDSRDSEARKKARFIKRWQGKGRFAQSVATAKTWLRERGYSETGERNE